MQDVVRGARPEPVRGWEMVRRDGPNLASMLQAVGICIMNPWADRAKGEFSKGNWREVLTPEKGRWVAGKAGSRAQKDDIVIHICFVGAF